LVLSSSFRRRYQGQSIKKEVDTHFINFSFENLREMVQSCIWLLSVFFKNLDLASGINQPLD
jgi:hypothetical protein